MFNKSVDKIVSVFTKAIDELEKLENGHHKVNENLQELIDVSNISMDKRKKEIARSRAVREKLVAITAGM